MGASILSITTIDQVQGESQLTGMLISFDDSSRFAFYAIEPDRKNINALQVAFYPAVFQSTASRAINIISMGKGEFFNFDAVVDIVYDYFEEQFIGALPPLTPSWRITFADKSQLVLSTTAIFPPDASSEFMDADDVKDMEKFTTNTGAVNSFYEALSAIDEILTQPDEEVEED